jgi:hypothetical protein
MRKNKCFSLSRSAAAPRAAPDRARPGHASSGSEHGWEIWHLANPFAPVGDHFPDGQVLSWLLQPREGIEAAAFLLVRAYVVGATGFEPVTPSVSGTARPLREPAERPDSAIEQRW